MPTIESPIDRRTHRDPSRTTAGFARAALLVAIVLVNLTALMVALLGGAPAAHAASPSLHIMVPKPTSNMASGPVGANVSISGVGDPSRTYKIGYAAALTPSPPSPSLDACSQGFQDLQPAHSVTTQKDGSFSDTFVWPSSAGASGSSYYVCAQESPIVVGSLNPSIQSSELFKVLASDAPSITINVASSSTNATPVPTPTDGGYYAGSRIEITGTNFLPSGTALRAYVTVNPSFSASDAHAYRPLLQDNGSATFSSDNSGSFDKIVTLPQSPQGVGVYLHVVSTDNTSTFPPALDAKQQINLDKALPTPTPSPTPNTTVTISPSTTASHGSNGQPPTRTPDPANVLAVIGLSGLSVILFVIGIILMTSASTMVERRQ